MQADKCSKPSFPLKAPINDKKPETKWVPASMLRSFRGANQDPLQTNRFLNARCERFVRFLFAVSGRFAVGLLVRNVDPFGLN
jgi:hypothetical protein